MRFCDRLKWCVIGGFAYVLGRFLFHWLQTGIGGYCNHFWLKCNCSMLIAETFLSLVLFRFFG